MNQEEAHAAFLRKLKDSALSEKDATSLGFSYFTSDEVAAKPKLHVPDPGAGFVIPYYSVDCEFLQFFRFRYLEQPARRGPLGAVPPKTEKRYVQPPGLAPRVYFSPLFDWHSYFAKPRETRILLITEGELKASCACKYKFPCIALGGVYNFRSARLNQPLIPDLENLDLEDTTVYITYDSDAATNTDVIRAENRLAQELVDRKAIVYVVRLPTLPEQKKTGLDDFLVAKGDLLALIEKAEEWGKSKALRIMNEQVIFLRENCNVLEPSSRHRWRASDFAHAAYATSTFTLQEPGKQKGEVKMTTRRTAEEWLKWPGRAEVERSTYRPGEPLVVNREYNMWRSWGVAEEHIREGSTKLWRRLIDFLISGPDAAHRDWLERWLAYPLQHPGAKLLNAPVLWGTKQGTGKTLVGHTMERIYGENFSEINSQMIGSSHNEWVQYKQFVLGDEITGEDSTGRRLVSMDTLKGLVTRKKIYLNPKFVGGYFIPDCVNYFFTSNHPDVFHLEDTDRRFGIFEVRAAETLGDDFYGEYDRWYRSPAIGALFYYLLNLDLGRFNPNASAPATAARREMIADTKSDLGGWVAALRENPPSVLRTPSLNGASNGVAQRPLFTSTQIHHMYDPERKSRVTVNGMARELKRAGFRKALNGEPIWLGEEAGLQKLWIIQDIPTLSRVKNPETFRKIYQEGLKK